MEPLRGQVDLRRVIMSQLSDDDDVYFDRPAQSDSVQALAGDDHVTLDLGSSHATLRGGSGDDDLRFYEGDDRSALYGDSGNDAIHLDDAPLSRLGARAFGGSGDDMISGGIYTEAFGGAGNDTVSAFVSHGGAGGDHVTGNTAYGDAGDDVVDGNWAYELAPGDTIAPSAYGGAGNDVVTGFYASGDGDNDRVSGYGAYGGAGNDFVSAYEVYSSRYGEDLGEAHGDDGSDVVSGYTSYGDNGDDVVRASKNGYLGEGGQGHGGNGSDEIAAVVAYGDAGNDLIHASSLAVGGSGHDVFLLFDPPTEYDDVGDELPRSYNTRLADFMPGEDRIGIPASFHLVSAFTGNPGEIVLDAGSGKTYIDVEGDSAADATINGASTDMFISTALNGTEAAESASGSGMLMGRGGDDMLSGANADDWLFGGFGNDLMSGGKGADLLVGGAGDDTLYGGNGEDELDGGDGADNLSGGAGADFIYGGAADDRIAGGAGSDRLLGEGGNDHINAGDGNDIIRGGMGNDYLLGGAGADIFVFSATDYAAAGDFPYPDAPTRDTIADFAIGEDKLDLAGLSGAKMSLSHEVGYDVIAIDINHNGSADMKVRVETTGGQFSKADILATAVIVSGTANNDRLYGGFGSDSLSGLAGDDILYGGANADRLSGGLGEDRFVFDTLETSADSDTVADFSSGKDKLVLSMVAFAALTADTSGAPITANGFYVGKSASTLDQHVIYNSATGALYYDSDGSGAAAQVQIATLTYHPAVAAVDILII